MSTQAQGILKDGDIPSITERSTSSITHWKAVIEEAFRVMQLHKSEWTIVTKAFIQEYAREHMIAKDQDDNWSYDLIMNELERQYRDHEDTVADLEFRVMVQLWIEISYAYFRRLEETYLYAHHDRRIGEGRTNNDLIVQAWKGLNHVLSQRVPYAVR